MKYLRHLLVFILAFYAINAQCFNVDGINYNITNSTEKTASVEKKSSGKYTGDIVIPTTVMYNGVTYNVTSIGNNAFAYCSDLTSVEIPNSVTSIGEKAFYNCSSIESIEIPNSVTSIGSFAFSGCSGLTNIEIPNNVAYIGDGAFRFCEELISVTLGDKIEYLGLNVFFGSEKLKDVFINDIAAWCNIEFNGSPFYYPYNLYLNDKLVTELIIPENTPEIKNYAFCENTNLTSITIPSSITSIGDNAFSGCTGLRSITIPNSVTTIGDMAFASCSGLTSINIPNSVTTIGYGAFLDCSNLKEIHINDLAAWCNIEFTDYLTYTPYTLYLNGKQITSLVIPEGVTEIKQYTFGGCNGITKAIIPNSVRKIGKDAFFYCSNLKSVVIGNGIEKIHSYAFDFQNITDIYCKSNKVPEFEETEYANFDYLTSINLHIPAEAIDNYKTTEPWSKCYNIIAIEENGGYSEYATVDGIKYSVVYDTQSATVIANDSEYTGDIVIPSEIIHNDVVFSVTGIGESAFANCSNLTSITIPNSVTSIARNAFRVCKSLKSVTIPNSVTSIGVDAFAFCNEIANLSLGKNVTIIGECAFQGCKGLESLEIPYSVTTIGRAAFSGCSGLVSIIIPKSIINMGENPFSSCSGLKSIVVEDGNSVYDCRNNCNAVIHTGTNELISGCKNTEIPNGVVSIGHSAFFDCNGLTSIVIPNSVTTIGNMAFSSCDSLTSIVIPNSVTAIGDMAFENYKTGLTSVTIGSNVVSIGVRAFDCSYLTSIKSLIPANKLFVPGSEAFQRVDKYNGVLYVPYKASGAYKSTDGWKEFRNIVEFKNTYNATFNVENEEFATYGIEEGESIVYPDVPQKEGYTLQWDTIIEIMPSNDITITGKYHVNNYTVTYVVDGEVYKTDSVTYGTEIVLIDEPVKEGHTFSGWGEIPSTMPAEDITVSGTFTANDYVVTYIVDGEVYKTDSVTYGTEIVLIDEPVKEGHTFSGWSEIPSTMPAEDITVSGTFTANDYVVTYIVDGEVYKTDSVTYGTEIVLIDEPVKEGHTFSGWSEIPSIMPAEDITVSGTFTANDYAVTYIVDGEVYKTDSVTYGTEIILIDEPTKEGHTFSGWGEIPSTMPAEDIVISGSFSVNSYTVTYVVDGVEYQTQTVAYGTEIPTIETPTKEGHTFSGWSEIPSTMPAEDITVSGTFTANDYVVTYIVDGEVYKTDSVTYGTEIILIDEPTKEGHTFSGWGEKPSTMPAESITISGYFTVNSYSVIFAIDGKIYESMTVEFGAEIPTVETPVKEGHTFSGWSEIPSTMPAEDIVINGSFIVNRYTVTFVVDGEVYKSAEIEYGAEIPIIEAPSKNGRKFSGWSEIPSTMPAENVIVEGKFCYTIIFMVDGKYYHSSEIYYGNDIKAPLEVPQKVGHTFVDWGDLPETMPARDMTIHAVFSVNEYQLIFIIDGEVYETLYIEYGSKIEYPQIEGYVITWETDDLPETMPAENLIIIGTSTLDTAIKGIHEVHSDYIIYTLDGHRVLDIENLRSGFYIINGKKVFVK